MRSLFWSILFLVAFENKLLAQGGLPAYVMSNSSINAGNCWIVDTDSLRGNYAFGNTTLVLTGPAGSRFGIFLDSFRLGSDYDSVIIYDGNSPSATTLTYFTSYNFTSIPPRSVKTTSNVVTIRFHADPYLSSPGRSWRLGIRPINNVSTNLSSFLPVFQSELGGPGNTDLGDYDNDGDKDVLMDGFIYQNLAGFDSTFLFNRALNMIGSWSSAKMASADFNGDGLKDIFMTGVSNLSGTYRATTAIFRNNGNNSFSRVIIPGMTDVGDGASSVIDINNDGRMDISYTGSTNLAVSGAIFKIYINNGNFSFSDYTNNLPGAVGSNIDWSDYDNDGDPDLVINGHNSSGSLSGIYKNNGSGSFSAVNIPIISLTSGGAVKWVDFNKDGRMDFINTGVTTPNNVNAIAPEIFMNNGADNFTRIVSNLPPRWASNLDAFDYDNDGDMDIVMNGFLPSSPETDAAVYKNNGSGNFTRVSYRPGVQSANAVKWIDLNQDNKKDLFISGRGNLYPGYVLLNMGADSFRTIGYPFVNYALSSLGTNVLVEDLNADGLPDFMFAGNMDDQDCVEGNGSILIYSQGWKKRPYTGFRKVIDLRTIPGTNVSSGSFWRWGDVNNDGRSDIILTNGGEPLRIIKNDGNNNFSLMYSGWINPNKVYDQAGTVDINNDGVNELYVIPNKLYRWNGTSFQTLYEATGIGCESGPSSTCWGFFDFADYTRDGYMDVVFIQGGAMYIMKNNGSGAFVPDYSPALFPNQFNDGKEIRWIDYDADGDPDLFTRDAAYENTDWGGLRYRGAVINDFGNIAFGDFNMDGKNDIVTINRTPPSFGPGYLFYNQQGTSFFQDLTPANFVNSYGGSYKRGISVADLDNDGDNDIVYATGGNCTFSGVLINLSSEIYPNIRVMQPNGGEVYTNGTTVPVQWTGSQLSNTVKIELSTNGGSSYSLISNAAAGNSSGGVYNWAISGVPASTQCRIRITDNVTGQLADVSDRNFTINSATGVPNITRNNSLRIFPNPATGEFYCEVKGVSAGVMVTISIFDLTGRELYQSIYRAGANGVARIPDNILPQSGYYIVQARYNTVISTQKLLKP